MDDGTDPIRDRRTDVIQGDRIVFGPFDSVTARPIRSRRPTDRWGTAIDGRGAGVDSIPAPIRTGRVAVRYAGADPFRAADPRRRSTARNRTDRAGGARRRGPRPRGGVSGRVVPSTLETSNHGGRVPWQRIIES